MGWSLVRTCRCGARAEAPINGVGQALSLIPLLLFSFTEPDAMDGCPACDPTLAAEVKPEVMQAYQRSVERARRNRES
jgi:hypothetical protein